MATIDISRSLVRLRLPGSYFSFLHKARECESARVCESGRDRVYERRGMVYESVYECVCVYERVREKKMRSPGIEPGSPA